MSDDMARRKPETVQDYVDAFKVDYAEMAYKAWRNLPATQRPTRPWDELSGPERNEWRAIVEPVVERVRAEKNAHVAEALRELRDRLTLDDDPEGYFRKFFDDEITNITDTTKPTKPAVAEDEEPK